MKINLLPKEERPLKHSQVRWEFLVGLLGLVALAAALSFSWLEGVRVESLEAALRDAQVREARLQVQVRDVNALRQEIAALEAQEDLLQGLLGGTGHAAAALGAVGSFSLERLWIEGWPTLPGHHGYRLHQGCHFPFRLSKPDAGFG